MAIVGAIGADLRVAAGPPAAGVPAASPPPAQQQGAGAGHAKPHVHGAVRQLQGTALLQGAGLTERLPVGAEHLHVVLRGWFPAFGLPWPQVAGRGEAREARAVL